MIFKLIFKYKKCNDLNIGSEFEPAKIPIRGSIGSID
jgi:hypothetical protein